MIDQLTVMDTETTGLEPETDRIVEMATVPVLLADHGWIVERGIDTLVNPGRGIPPEASAVHHLVDQDVSGAPDLEAAIDLCDLRHAEVMVAHNAKYDRSFLPGLASTPFICTYRCALHLWPDAPGHGNQTLRYWRRLGLSEHLSAASSSRSMLPHSALFDSYTTAQILVDMLQERTVDELIHLSTQPVVLTKARFGKHAGKRWEDIVRIDSGWCDWYLRLPDGDPDVRHTIVHHRRRPPQGRLI